jgi:murein DD-endopeptidase MepM/ murein hydrolase activator NlpD
MMNHRGTGTWQIHRPVAAVLALLLLVGPVAVLPARADENPGTRLTQPGESLWSLSLRTGAQPNALATANAAIHPLLPYPVAGTTIAVPPAIRPPLERGQRVAVELSNSLVAVAMKADQNPWALAQVNGLKNPAHPAGPGLWIPGSGGPPSILAGPFVSIEVAPVPAVAGQALQVRVWTQGDEPVSGDLEGHVLHFAPEGESQVALLGLGGFVEPADYSLTLVAEETSWTGWVRTITPAYGLEEIWLSGETQQYLDAEAIRAEQARLDVLWSLFSPVRFWNEPWGVPVEGEYEITSFYGTRRSYNGGPAGSYHEGVDFRGALGRTVVAPADGVVVLAEPLYVRGNAVVIHHGMGVYTGYYHLSQIEVAAGETISAGQKLGEFGSTGLSTGSHLHWDVVVAGINVDGLAWRALTAEW